MPLGTQRQPGDLPPTSPTGALGIVQVWRRNDNYDEDQSQMSVTLVSRGAEDIFTGTKLFALAGVVSGC